MSGQPRRIARFEKLGGGIWFTFDNELAEGETNPLETIGDGFQFTATEQIGHLPNGMLAYYLGNEKGERQNSAPDFVGHDKTSTNNVAKIEIGLSCVRCHSNGGLQDVRDWIKKQYRPPVELQSPDYEKLVEAKRAYFRRMEPDLKKDRERYAAALLEATGLKPEAYSLAVGNVWKAYADADDAVDLARAAREFGVTKQHLQTAFRWYRSVPGRGLSVLDMYIHEEKEQEAVPVDQFNARYALGQHALQLWVKEGKK